METLAHFILWYSNCVDPAETRENEIAKDPRVLAARLEFGLPARRIAEIICMVRKAMRSPPSFIKE